jgi:hypothetical protein
MGQTTMTRGKIYCIFGLIFKVTEWDPKVGKRIVEVGRTSNSTKTDNIQIIIKEDVDQNLTEKEKGQ